jgi:hypothetical protein
MNKLHLTLATVALALGAQVASAQVAGPFEGGQSANALATAPFAGGADRATVSAEGREAARRLNSRSGQQNETERAINSRFAGTLSRESVRAEASASLRDGGSQVFEGGQAGTITSRAVAPVASTLASGTPVIVR